MKLLLLGGGGGRRLWPYSNGAHSKHFFKYLPTDFGENQSLIQRVCAQLEELNLLKNSYIITNKNQLDLLQIQLGSKMNVIVEPQQIGIIPAILLSSAYLYSQDSCSEDTIVGVLPVDRLVDNNYYDQLVYLAEYMKKSGAILAEIGFQRGENNNFIYRLEYVISLLQKNGLPTKYEELLLQYHVLENIDWDEELFEKEKENVLIVPPMVQWQDQDTWKDITDQMRNSIHGTGTMIDSYNTHLINTLSTPILINGIDNAVVVASPDGILVSDKEKSGNIMEATNPFIHRPLYEEKRWGWYKVIDNQETNGKQILTKRLHVHEGANLSYQYHLNREEIWTIIDGEGLFALDGKILPIKSGDVLHIPKSVKHGVKALTHLDIIEVQMGSSLIEGDIVRVCMSWEEVEEICN